jgi:hypothetical protein
LISIACLTLAACTSTPQHSNTLIFGTSTRLAIDVSQEPTGALGATIGYKRHEAVWMPLLANETVQSGGTPPTPARCSTDPCRKFVGEAGSQGGAAGRGARDTYSVLATFTGDMSGSAQGAQAKAGVAQYFATGLAARLLAQYGGAAAVGSAASAPSGEAIRAAQVVKAHVQKVDTIGARLSRTDGSVNATLVTRLFGLEPAKNLPKADREQIAQMTRRSELQDYLEDAPEDVAQKIFDTLDSL